tara:strand:- start:74 stop:280 length:207 start_codon:yes stop_codon:yes gene_type:complete
MKLILFIILVVILSGCSSHSVKIGKRCTNLAKDNTYEKSFIWVVNKRNQSTFDQKINKENCLKNGEKL